MKLQIDTTENLIASDCLTTADSGGLSSGDTTSAPNVLFTLTVICTETYNIEA